MLWLVLLFLSTHASALAALPVGPRIQPSFISLEVGWRIQPRCRRVGVCAADASQPPQSGDGFSLLKKGLAEQADLLASQAADQAELLASKAGKYKAKQEVVAAKIRDEIDTDGDGIVSAAEVAEYAQLVATAELANFVSEVKKKAVGEAIAGQARRMLAWVRAKSARILLLLSVDLLMAAVFGRLLLGTALFCGGTAFYWVEAMATVPLDTAATLAAGALTVSAQHDAMLMASAHSIVAPLSSRVAEAMLAASSVKDVLGLRGIVEPLCFLALAVDACVRNSLRRRAILGRVGFVLRRTARLLVPACAALALLVGCDRLLEYAAVLAAGGGMGATGGMGAAADAPLPVLVAVFEARMLSPLCAVLAQLLAQQPQLGSLAQTASEASGAWAASARAAVGACFSPAAAELGRGALGGSLALLSLPLWATAATIKAMLGPLALLDAALLGTTSALWSLARVAVLCASAHMPWLCVQLPRLWSELVAPWLPVLKDKVSALLAGGGA